MKISVHVVCRVVWVSNRVLVVVIVLGREDKQVGKHAANEDTNKERENGLSREIFFHKSGLVGVDNHLHLRHDFLEATVRLDEVVGNCTFVSGGNILHIVH